MRAVRNVIALVVLGGCSFATMRSPHGTPPECTDKQGAAFVDLVLTVATPFVAYAASRDGLVTVMISTPVMAALGASSVYGFLKADRCYRAKRDYQMMSAPPQG
jgi:hypothetical protein